jgi:NDP-sugar pyrophosphorylase family protein
MWNNADGTPGKNGADPKEHEKGAITMKTTLVILAAGIGSRFGGGIKQLEPVGPGGEIIIDYSIHDAIAAGFDKIVFIIRRDIEADFKEVIGNRMENLCQGLGVEVRYAFQELTDIPAELPPGRVKPWGTGHAVLACKDLIAEPFAVINADDYYGKEGFVKAAAFLKQDAYGLVGYVLKNTLSDIGGVTRGICSVEDGRLTGIDETHDIVKTPGGARSGDKDIPLDALVSMNFWCLPTRFLRVLEEGFPRFLETMQNPLKDEYLLPIIVDGLLKEGAQVSVLPSRDAWFGVTYKEDKQKVVDSFKALYAKGAYAPDLYADLKK